MKMIYVLHYNWIQHLKAISPRYDTYYECHTTLAEKQNALTQTEKTLRLLTPPSTPSTTSSSSPFELLQSLDTLERRKKSQLVLQRDITELQGKLQYLSADIGKRSQLVKEWELEVLHAWQDSADWFCAHNIGRVQITHASLSTLQWLRSNSILKTTRTYHPFLDYAHAMLGNMQPYLLTGYLVTLGVSGMHSPHMLGLTCTSIALYHGQANLRVRTDVILASVAVMACMHWSARNSLLWLSCMPPVVLLLQYGKEMYDAVQCKQLFDALRI
jgi:hypothetical protein